MAAVPVTMSDADKAKRAVECKNEGNAAFKAKNYTLAIKHFTEACQLCPNDQTYFSNRSAAYLAYGQASGDYDKLDLALEDAEKCVELAPDWSKGYLRRAAAQQALSHFEDAVTGLAEGLTHCAADASLLTALQEAQNTLVAAKSGALGAAMQRRAAKTSSKKSRDRKKGKKGDEKEASKYVIGIDLGTTFSCVGVWKDDGVVILSNEDGERTTPSYITFDENGERFTGQQARAMQSRYPQSTVYDIKRVIGQRYSDSGVEKDIRSFPFPVVRGENDKVMVELPVGGGKKELFAPEALSAMVLARLKKVAENYLGEPVTDAVITVPAYFNDAQRNATKAAGMIAGLNVLRIINEPTAAALSYGLDNVKGGKKVHVLIFDLGGGTFDVSLLKIEEGVFEVKATAGDTHLGGEDFDNAVVEYLLQEAASAGFPAAKDDSKAYRRLRLEAERVKRLLSLQQSAEVRVEAFGADGKDFVFTLTREKFEALNAGLFERCLDTVKRVLKDGKMKQSEVDEVVLVGGSTRIPKIQAMLQEFLGGKELCKSLNPDEAVAYGAAVQGAILSGKRHRATEDLLLMDVTPLSLGIETTGKVMSVIIPRNTPIPCSMTQVYTTESDYQTAVDISVYEGERLKTDENNLLGEFTITGIQRAKKGEPKVNVSFSLDSNGILSVKAVDQETGAAANIEISSSNRASAEDVERMIREAAQYRKDDEVRIRRIEAANRLEEVINEAIEHAETLRGTDDKIANLISNAAQADATWLEENRETGNPTDFLSKVRDLQRRMASKNRRR